MDMVALSLNLGLVADLLCVFIGFGTTMILSPLAADMCAIVSQLGEDHRSLFGPSGAFAKAYGLFNTALAVGAMVGPALAGLLYEIEGWNVAVWAMAILCASGTVPVVRPPLFLLVLFQTAEIAVRK